MKFMKICNSIVGLTWMIESKNIFSREITLDRILITQKNATLSHSHELNILLNAFQFALQLGCSLE